MSKASWIANACAIRVSWSCTRKPSAAPLSSDSTFPLLNGWREWKSKTDDEV